MANGDRNQEFPLIRPHHKPLCQGVRETIYNSWYWRHGAKRTRIPHQIRAAHKAPFAIPPPAPRLAPTPVFNPMSIAARGASNRERYE
ncbi:jg12151 [Pararge aegeria aegeria]|uniref:Jg12151 protein n=1 Tax=Pararge aegeria aegeria TaxID=348720 RepID=A0A8S4S424_9NEOP|nr:jg12151 [Pararge aegeria aegeria]